MKKLEMEKATQPLAIYARRAGREPVLLVERGKPVAALVGVANADIETAVVSTHPTFLQVIERSRIRHKQEGGITPDEMRRRLGLSGRKHRGKASRTPD